MQPVGSKNVTILRLDIFVKNLTMSEVSSKVRERTLRQALPSRVSVAVRRIASHFPWDP